MVSGHRTTVGLGKDRLDSGLSVTMRGNGSENCPAGVVGNVFGGITGEDSPRHRRGSPCGGRDRGTRVMTKEAVR